MFPLYANYAGLAPISKRAYLASLGTFEVMGNIFLLEWLKKVNLLREKTAKYFGCKAEQVAFVPSTTIGLTIAANALDWKAGDKILFDENDYPANVLCWKKLERFGVELDNIHDLDDKKLSTAKMLVTSTVDYQTGIERQWQEQVRLANKAGLYTCVDAIQSAGIKKAWIPEIDFWCAGVQKWMVSGLGLAVMILSEKVLENLETNLPSWLGLNDIQDSFSGMKKTAQGWEFGWIASAPLARFDANMDYFLKLGQEAITNDLKEKRDLIHEHLLEMDFPVVSCPSNWSGIVSFKAGVEGAKRIVEHGYKEKIITAPRGDYVRISPHIFNSRSDIERICKWLSKVRNEMVIKGW